eukprot:XP_024378496.1 uncharacterized protein LOC112283679 [Physcomitrella patens]
MGDKAQRQSFNIEVGKADQEGAGIGAGAGAKQGGVALPPLLWWVDSRRTVCVLSLELIFAARHRAVGFASHNPHAPKLSLTHHLDLASALHRIVCASPRRLASGRQPAMAMMGSRRLGASLYSRFLSSAASSSSAAPSAASSGEIGVQDFVNSIKGAEPHAAKIAQAIFGVPSLLQTRSSRLKKMGIPCKQRKMILRYTEKYRQGIWTPRMSTKQ